MSPKLIAVAARIRYISPEEYPRLHLLVEALSKQAHIPKPRIAIAPSKEPNAFVFGRSRSSATLVVHEGLLPILNSEELKAVIAHEIGHIKHGDVYVMTFVSFIPVIAYIVAQQFFWSSIIGSGNNNEEAYFIIIGIFAFLAYFLSNLLILALSRARESYADLYSANATGSPKDLARSLVKITSANSSVANAPQNSTIARSFYLVDFFTVDRDLRELIAHKNEVSKFLGGIDIEEIASQEKSKRSNIWGILNGITMTHPPIYKRVLDLFKLQEKGLVL
ncbi:MAG: zinc metalloprotease HtpX, partial [Candidatus Micrarchaeaceae archaeon]